MAGFFACVFLVLCVLVDFSWPVAASSVHRGHWKDKRGDPQQSFLHGGQNTMSLVFLNSIPAIANEYPDAVCNDGRRGPFSTASFSGFEKF